MPDPQPNTPLTVFREDGRIWSHLRRRWLVETPEETVRQEYLLRLVNEYEYSLDQMDEELEITGRGSGHARADFVIWRTPDDKQDQRNPLLIVECKSDNVTIQPADYSQGDNYARLTGARFFITHNTRETRFWRVVHTHMPKSLEEVEAIPHAGASDKEIEELLNKLKVFREDEFANLLHVCHNVIRNLEKKDPADAFDEIAKILFIKVWVERSLRLRGTRQNLFSVEFLDSQVTAADPLDSLFQNTKVAFSADKIFADADAINLEPATSRRIVKLLERYNLSDTSEDIKGIAFERFLGKTFRGEIGQFFTPRTVVEFMIRMMDPQEGETICDPACGSGGFLIRFFEIVREKILARLDQEYAEYRDEVEANPDLDEDQKAALLRAKHEELREALKPDDTDSAVWKLANRCIYGTDANERMARTSKMNMIMHGDGHGGVHFHDGFLNVNGIFEGRFDIVLTNPPFGASVEPDDVVSQADVTLAPSVKREYEDAYGQHYKDAIARVRAAVGRPKATLYTLPKSARSKTPTEILFLERCLNLLRPGGRMGIVLPDGILNNPSLDYVRDFCEQRAFIRAVVSMPEQTFKSSGTKTVKTSLLFMQKFTAQEAADWERVKHEAYDEVKASRQDEIDAEVARSEEEEQDARENRGKRAGDAIRKHREAYLETMHERILEESVPLARERFSYPIFMYEAERVGITSTGAADLNELYRDESQLHPVEMTCLDLYRAFCENPAPFLAAAEETEAAAQTVEAEEEETEAALSFEEAGE